MIKLSKIYFPIITQDETRLPFYVTGIGIQENQEHIQRPLGFPQFHWIHTKNGKGKLILNNKEYIITENMGFFIYPGVPHEYYTIEGNWETHWVTFEGHALPELLKQIGLSDSCIFFLQDVHLIEECFSEIMRSAGNTAAFNGFQTSVHLYQFLIMCRNCICNNGNKLKYDKLKQLSPIIDFLENNYFKNPSLKDMAEIIDVTPHHLCRLFKEVFKIRPFVYLAKLRLQKAKELMMISDNLTIKYVSKKVGYNDISYFCSVFKQYEGITPTEFKSIHRKE